jgi:fructose-1,6-bisphosphatase/inositol monophosphatase family enzyme
MDKDPILAVAIHAARRGASILVDVSRDLKRKPSHAKGHADIVSNADTEAENAMIATLRAAFPEHAIVGKEAGEIVSQIVGGNRAARRTRSSGSSTRSTAPSISATAIRTSRCRSH